jgi:methylated-DNA-[protein]-cysteine S-methyltransferase
MDRIVTRWAYLEGPTMVRAGANDVGDEMDRAVCLPTCHRLRAVDSEYRRSFRSVTDAATAGFQPCPHCRTADLRADSR